MMKDYITKKDPNLEALIARYKEPEPKPVKSLEPSSEHKASVTLVDDRGKPIPKPVGKRITSPADLYKAHDERAEQRKKLIRDIKKAEKTDPYYKRQKWERQKREVKDGLTDLVKFIGAILLTGLIAQAILGDGPRCNAAMQRAQACD